MHKAIKDGHDLNEILITLGVGGVIGFIVVVFFSVLLLGSGALLTALGYLVLWGFVAWLIFRDPEAELKRDALGLGETYKDIQAES